MSEFPEEAKNIAPQSDGYLYWVNGGSRVTWTHPNDWQFENLDGVNYIKTFAGMNKPGILFEGWNTLLLPVLLTCTKVVTNMIAAAKSTKIRLRRVLKNES